MAINDLIKTFREKYDERIKQSTDEVDRLMKEKEFLLSKLEILKKYENMKPKTEEEFRELSSILCFNSISFCCAPPNSPYGAGKPCIWRDSFLKVLDVSTEDFLIFKKDLDKSFYSSL